MKLGKSYEEYCRSRGLIAPSGLTGLLTSDVATILDGLLYRPDVPAVEPPSLAWALDRLHEGISDPPMNLLPLLPVDDASIACAICASRDDPEFDDAGHVVRWHLGDIPSHYQHALLDHSAEMYVRSVADELAVRRKGLTDIRRIAKRYRNKYLLKGSRPPSWAERPVQLACQNVIIGLAAFAHESRFEGLRVPVYLTCEVPHLATHEANRALTALMLCDSFQNGGTMEIRFGSRHRQEVVPAGLRRFGRSLGVELGAETEWAITPAEARQLFLRVTPMPDGLRDRVYDLMDRGLASPERLCYTLLAPIWREIELDYLLATSSRIASILEGGASPGQRRARLAELEVSRAALMVGMLYRRLDSKDAATGSDRGIRVFEDSRTGVEWTMNDELGAVGFTSIPAGPVPWAASERNPLTMGDHGILVAIPRALPTPADHELVINLQTESASAVVALLVPADMADTVPSEIPILLCPERLGELDIEIESRSLKSQVSRL